MRAAYIEQPGPPEAIVYGELPLPTIGDHDVLVHVSAVTVNHIDTYIRSGSYPLPLPHPFVVGRDMTGVVSAVGSAVEEFQPGESVWSNCLGYAGMQGTFAEYLAVPAERLFRLPYGVDHVEAVSLLHSGLTAAVGLISKARLVAGETIFISGGSGSVGTAVLQVAKTLGAHVAVTAGSPEKQARCRQLGADRVIDYHHENIVDALRQFAPAGVNVYWEATNQLDLERALSVLTPHGRIVVMAGRERRCELPVGPFYTNNCTLYGFTITDTALPEIRSLAQQINGWLSNNTLQAKIQEVLPLSAAAHAHRLQEQGELSGKIVLVPQTETLNMI